MEDRDRRYKTRESRRSCYGSAFDLLLGRSDGEATASMTTPPTDKE